MEGRQRLKNLHPLMRLGVTLLVLTLLGGYVFSGLHMMRHYDNRDGRPGLTLDDIRAAYHGVRSPALLETALKSRHPDTLPDAERRALLAWLAGDSLSRDYDNFDLGDDAPAEIIASSCLSCHARGAQGAEAYPRLPLEFWDDIEPLARSIDVQPNDEAIVIASLHAHAPSMSIILLVLGVLAYFTRLPSAAVGAIVAVSASGLLADMSGQYLARGNDAWVYAIVGGGTVYGVGTALLVLIIVADLWVPGGRRPHRG